MAATILDYTFQDTERGVLLEEGEILRPWKDDSWTTIRVGIRFTTINDYGDDLPTGTIFKLGLCSGSTNTLGSATTDHGIFYGNILNASGFGQLLWNNTSYNISGNPLVVYTDASCILFGLHVNSSSYTIPANTSNFRMWGAASSNTTITPYGAVYFQLTRGGSPTTYKVRVGYLSVSNTPTVAYPSVSRDTFIAEMQATTPNFAPWCANSSDSTSILSIDESTNGTFDHANFFWNRSSSVAAPFVSDFMVVKLA